MEEVGHKVSHLHEWKDNEWRCNCGEEFESQAEAMTHVRAAGSNRPENRLMNCIARQTHYPQPIEILYEMRGTVIPSGAVVASMVPNADWFVCPQGSAERSKVTKFGCPNCGHIDVVDWSEREK